MAGIKAPIQDILNKLSNNTSFQYVRVWNNQLQLQEDGTIESFPYPCAFVQIENPADYQQLGLGITLSDLIIRVHIGQEYYDAQDGTIGENLSIFDLRDEVIRLLTYYEATQCSGLMKIAENQDYTHTNVYHYMIDFRCSYVDDRGDQRVNDIVTTPPTGIEIDPTIVTEIN